MDAAGDAGNLHGGNQYPRFRRTIPSADVGYDRISSRQHRFVASFFQEHHMVRNALALAASTLVVLTGLSTLAQQPKREVKWNNPDGRKIEGVTHGSFKSEAIGQEV